MGAFYLSYPETYTLFILMPKTNRSNIISFLIFQYLSARLHVVHLFAQVHLLNLDLFQSLFLTSKHLPASTDLLREVRY